MSTTERPEPPSPLDPDGVVAVVVGTVVWLVALVLALVFHDRLSDHGHGWWIWVCVAGAALGLIGIPYMRRYQKAVRRQGKPPSEA